MIAYSLPAHDLDYTMSQLTPNPAARQITNIDQDHSQLKTILIPLRHRRRWLKFAYDRFAFHRRPVVWAIMIVFAVLMVAMSAELKAALVAMVASLLAFLPGLSSYSQSAYALASQLVNSPSQTVIDSSIESILHLVFPLIADETMKSVLLTAAPLLCLVALIGAFARPTHLLISRDGLRMQWQYLAFLHRGPLVPWTDISRVSFSNTSGTAELKFSVSAMPGAYKLFLPVGYQDCFSLNLLDPAISAFRPEIFQLLTKSAPPYLLEPEAINALHAAQSHSYTELWLEALNSAPAPERLEPLQPGTKLSNGRYKVSGLLGAGGQATVYLAKNDGHERHHTADDCLSGTKLSLTSGGNPAETEMNREHQVIDTTAREVVLKEFVLPLGIDHRARKAALDRFIVDAEMLRSLDDEHIVKFIDCFVEDHRGYLVMECIDGRSMRELVESHGPFEEKQTIELMLQMCSILKYLHAQVPYVVHRDFTPDNLILDRVNILKLVDFNIAQQSLGESRVSAIVGKPAYMPPEQVQGDAVPQTDIYAAGATAFFLLTGQDPEPLEASHPRTTSPHVSTAFDAIVAKATMLDLQLRYQNADELEHDLLQARALLTSSASGN